MLDRKEEVPIRPVSLSLFDYFFLKLCRLKIGCYSCNVVKFQINMDNVFVSLSNQIWVEYFYSIESYDSYAIVSSTKRPCKWAFLVLYTTLQVLHMMENVLVLTLTFKTYINCS